jgi:hypothetical protein
VLAEQQDGATSSSSSVSHSGSGPLSSLTSLTALTLGCVRLEWRAGVQGISTLKRLRQLTLSDLQDEDGHGVDCFSPLPQLPQLTGLAVLWETDNSAEKAAAVVAQLTGLRSLELIVKGLMPVGAACLLALTNLTKLHCCYHTQRYSFRTKQWPEFAIAEVDVTSTVSPDEFMSQRNVDINVSAACCRSPTHHLHST